MTSCYIAVEPPCSGDSFNNNYCVHVCVLIMTKGGVSSFQGYLVSKHFVYVAGPGHCCTTGNFRGLEKAFTIACEHFAVGVSWGWCHTKISWRECNFVGGSQTVTFWLWKLMFSSPSKEHMSAALIIILCSSQCVAYWSRHLYMGFHSLGIGYRAEITKVQKAMLAYRIAMIMMRLRIIAAKI